MRAKINILDNIDRIFLHVCYKQALLGTIGGPVSLISGVEQSLKSYLKKQATAVQLNQTAERHKRRDGIFWEIYAKRPPQITFVRTRPFIRYNSLWPLMSVCWSVGRLVAWLVGRSRLRRRWVGQSVILPSKYTSMLLSQHFLVISRGKIFGVLTLIFLKWKENFVDEAPTTVDCCPFLSPFLSIYIFISAEVFRHFNIDF